MNFIVGARHGGRVVAATLGLAALIATPAHARGSIANPYDCTPQAIVAQTFLPWNDAGQYTPVTNSGLENGAASWTLAGPATVVAGNEPWYVGGASDSKALDLPAGASAVTAPICIDETYPYFRLFARNAGVANGSLKIEVLGYDSKGRLLKTTPYVHATSSTAWQPTGMVNITAFAAKKTNVTAAPVAFRFTTTGAGARYQIDDVYIDPWARG